jgi:hypothetical protein
MSLISREDLFYGSPYKLRDICKIYQLTLKEIMDTLGLEKYHYYINLITMDEAELKELLDKKGKMLNLPLPKDFKLEISVFQYLMASAARDKTFFLDLKQAFSTFIKEDVLISTKSNTIIIGNPIHKKVIDEDSFTEFANVLKLFNKLKVKEPPPENETPMQRKFRLKREERDRVKEKQKSKDGDIIEFADIMSSVCIMNTGITALNIGDYTIYQIKELLERAQAKEAYHTELDMLMAGADSKKIKPKHYVRNLQKEVN